MAFMIGNIDKSAKETGVWKEFDGGEFLIAHISNEEFIKAREETKEDNKDQSEEERNLVYAKTLVRDWRNIVDLEGNDVPFSPELVAQELTENTDFLNFVLSTSTNLREYKRVKDAEKVEKVKKPSAGK